MIFYHSGIFFSTIAERLFYFKRQVIRMAKFWNWAKDEDTGE